MRLLESTQSLWLFSLSLLSLSQKEMFKFVEQGWGKSLERAKEISSLEYLDLVIIFGCIFQVLHFVRNKIVFPTSFVVMFVVFLFHSNSLTPLCWFDWTKLVHFLKMNFFVNNKTKIQNEISSFFLWRWFWKKIKKTNHFYCCIMVPTNPNTKRPMFMKVDQIHFIQPFFFIWFQKKLFGIEIDGNCVPSWFFWPIALKPNIFWICTSNTRTSKSIRSRFHEISCSFSYCLRREEETRNGRWKRLLMLDQRKRKKETKSNLRLDSIPAANVTAWLFDNPNDQEKTPSCQNIFFSKTFSLFRDWEREEESREKVQRGRKEERKNRERKYRKENLIFLKWGKKDEVDRSTWKPDSQCFLFTIFEWVCNPLKIKSSSKERERERSWVQCQREKEPGFVKEKSIPAASQTCSHFCFLSSVCFNAISFSPFQK